MADLGGRNPVCGTACRWNAAHFHACIFTGVYDRNIWDIDQQSGKPQAILRTANRLSRQDDALFYYSHVYTNGVDWRSSLWRRQLPDGLAGGLLAIGLHFVPMAWVHGRSMILLAVLLSANALTGMLWPDLSFHTLVYVDLAVKLFWGAALLLSGRPAAAGQSASPSAIAK